VIDCLSCRTAATIESQPIRERIWWDGTWRVAHAINCALPGWLVVLPARHMVSVADLTPEEAAGLGPLLAAVTRALTDVTGCAKTYVVAFGEIEAFAHLHFHVIPRSADLPDDLRGTSIFAYQKRPESEWVPAAEQDRIGAEVARRLQVGSPGSTAGRSGEER
jgi:diadenosine tetraphosphate (Ap4A) HIT family hydrolase